MEAPRDLSFSEQLEAIATTSDFDNLFTLQKLTANAKAYVIESKETERKIKRASVLVVGSLKLAIWFLRKFLVPNCLHSLLEYQICLVASDTAADNTATSVAGYNQWHLKIHLRDKPAERPDGFSSLHVMAVQDDCCQIGKCIGGLSWIADETLFTNAEPVVVYLFQCNSAEYASWYDELADIIAKVSIYCDDCPCLLQDWSKFTSLQSLELHCKRIENFGEYPEGSKLKTLTASDFRINLPHNIGQFHALEKLSWCDHSPIYGNGTSLLPGSVPQLQNLKVLELCGLSITELPPDFGCLKSLESVSMENVCNLKALPESIGFLPNLKSMEIDVANGCELDTLPSNFGHLKKLECLHIDGLNKLQELPKSFGSLQSLKRLYLGRLPKLRALPSSFGELTGLIHLEMGDLDLLQTLPDNFGCLSQLEHFELWFEDFSATAFVELPESFGSLNSLVTLKLRNVKNMATFPHRFGDLKGLENLELQFLGLDCFPPVLTSLKCLKNFNFEQCRSRETDFHAVPETIGNLKSLTHLSMDFCCFDNVPDTSLLTLPSGFALLENLKVLYLGNARKLEYLPKDFGELKNLERLTLASLGITSLPKSFGQLLNLKFLSLCDLNKLKALPCSFGDLKRIETIVCNGGTKIKYESVATTINLLTNRAGCYGKFMSPDGYLARLWTLSFLRSKIGSQCFPKSAWPYMIKEAERACGLHPWEYQLALDKYHSNKKAPTVYKCRKISRQPPKGATAIFCLLKEFGAEHIFCEKNVG